MNIRFDILSVISLIIIITLGNSLNLPVIFIVKNVYFLKNNCSYSIKKDNCLFCQTYTIKDKCNKYKINDIIIFEVKK
jgi:hypothetical protein